MKQVKVVLCCLSILLFSITGYAQTVQLRGTVTDTTGDPIIGASVQVKGTSAGTVSDMDGNFSLETSSGGVLIISYIGYKTQEVSIGGRSVLTITLQEDSETLDEVVVIGYGVQRKSDLTGSVTSIKAADMAKIAGGNAAEALQGKAPGVTILNVGTPGSAPIVRIRGVGTNGNPNPLYVVDGMLVDDIQYLNNHDIESMEVLKDASATAIYGSRGANGVIMVTTKKGKSGKPVVNFTGSEGFQFLTRKYEVANAQQYAKLMDIMDGGTSVGDVSSYGKGTDWLDEVTRNGWMRDYQLSVAGGSETINYNISAGYYKQDGVLKYTDYERFTLRINNEYKLGKRISIGHNISMSNSNSTPVGSMAAARLMNSLYRISPLISVYDEEGNFNNAQDNDIINPYAVLYYSQDANYNKLRVVSNGWLNYEIIDGLTFRTSYGIDWLYERNKIYERGYNFSTTTHQSHPEPSLEMAHVNDHTWLWENTLTYDVKLNKDHRLNLLAGFTAQNRNWEALSVVGTGFTSELDEYRYIQAAPADNIALNSGTRLPYSESMMSYLFRVNYSYKDRYLFTGTFRADGSSKFGPNNRWGYFPSIAAGWRVSQEEFMENADWISNLKIRASWGQIGNDKIDNYIFNKTIAQDVVYDAFFNYTQAANGTITRAVNPDIKWERTEQVDVGFEFGVLNNRLSFEFDWYNRDTKDLLYMAPIPGGSVGLASTYSNVGSVRNRGIDFSIGWEDQVADFSYGIRFTGSTYKNKVLDFGGHILTDAEWMSGANHRAEAGQPIGYFYGYNVIGMYRTQADLDYWNNYAQSKGHNVYHENAQLGDLIFEDVDGSGNINGDDQTNIGSPHPKFVGGLSLNLGYKGFDLTMDFTGTFGAKVYNSFLTKVGSYNTNLHVDWLDAWTPQNPNASMPRLNPNSVSTSSGTSLNVQNGNYIKARTMELGYTFPRSLMNKINIQNLRVYLNATNPFYITKYRGFSPEVANGSVMHMGTDFTTYPVAGSARIGINLTF